MDHLVTAVARIDPALALGQLLDDTYELVERLGGGGMGVVFRARDRRLGRDVAVKVVRWCGEQADQLRMFEREARATAQLLHPNIVTLHHVGEHDGHRYLVLELLNGETLSARLARRGGLPVGEALAILDAVLGALAFAHERGVLHRDLKPNNVFITGDERIKVLDFGIALSLDETPGPMTRTAGTPGYMAPEQREGDRQDARTDVWAAAVLMVECLTGRRPEAPTTSKTLASLDVPPKMRAVLKRALASNPEVRPRSASELRIELLHASGSLAPAGSSAKRWIVALGVAAALLGAAAMYAFEAPAAPRPVSGDEISGVWNTGMFGTMQLQVDPDGKAYAVYEWDDGVIVGNFADGVLVGKWCEVPTRKGPDDGGLLRLTFIRGPHRIAADGVWTYGDSATATWQPNWTGWKLTTAPPSELVQRLQRHVLCP